MASSRPGNIPESTNIERVHTRGSPRKSKRLSCCVVVTVAIVVAPSQGVCAGERRYAYCTCYPPFKVQVEREHRPPKDIPNRQLM